jgi:hypothetical protein
MGTFLITPDKFTKKTNLDLAAAMSMGWTYDPGALKYSITLLREITFHTPVISPDMVDILAGLNQSGGLFKGGNCFHLPCIESGFK